MKEIHIDCRRITSRDSFHGILASALSFPDYYGRNLDALYDCLTETPEPVHLVLESFRSAEDALGDYALSIRQVLQEAENACPDFFVSFF